MSAGQSLIIFDAQRAAFPPHSDSAYLSRRVINGTARQPNVIIFEGVSVPASNQWVYFEGIIPQSYSGNGLDVYIYWTITVISAANIICGAAFERIDSTLEIDTDSFAAAKTVMDAGGGAGGTDLLQIAIISFNHSEIDGLVAGDTFRMKFYRDTDDAGDTLIGDLELHLIEIREST